MQQHTTTFNNWLTLWSLSTSITWIVLIAWIPTNQACFSLDIFKKSCVWMQATGVDSHLRIDVCAGHQSVRNTGRIMVVTDGSGYKMTWECVEAFKGGSVLARVNNSNNILGYQCLQFSPLTKYVLRLKKTGFRENNLKRNCAKAHYTQDPAVLVALESFGNLHNSHRPKHCPFKGGFQLFPASGGTTSDPSNICTKDPTSQQPQRLQFQCGGNSLSSTPASSRTTAYFAQSCKSRDKIETDVDSSVKKQNTSSFESPKMNVQNMQCIDTWREKGTTKQREIHDGGEFKLLVMISQDHESSLKIWCLHYRHKPLSKTLVSYGKHGRRVSEAYQIYLDLRGQCFSDMPVMMKNDENFVGHMSAVVPYGNGLCQVATESSGCRLLDTEKCWNSSDCLQTCDRCQKKLSGVEIAQRFPEELIGTWKSFNTNTAQHDMVVDEQLVSSKSFGKFWLHSSVGGESKSDDFWYTLGENGMTKTSCLPEYTCAHFSNYAPGLLSVRMYPAKWGLLSGEGLPCSDPRIKHYRTPLQSQQKTSLTVFDKSKLKCDSLGGCEPCNMKKTSVYSSLGLGSDCGIKVHNCSLDCRVFDVSLDPEACPDTTANDKKILTQHACVTSFNIFTSVRVMLTQSAQTGDYLCWVFMSARLFILPPERCNPNRLYEALDELTAEKTYDPILLLKMRPTNDAHSGSDGGRNTSDSNCPSLFMIVILICLNLCLFRACIFNI